MGNRLGTHEGYVILRGGRFEVTEWEDEVRFFCQEILKARISIVGRERRKYGEEALFAALITCLAGCRMIQRLEGEPGITCSRAGLQNGERIPVAWRLPIFYFGFRPEMFNVLGIEVSVPFGIDSTSNLTFAIGTFVRLDVEE